MKFGICSSQIASSPLCLFPFFVFVFVCVFLIQCEIWLLIQPDCLICSLYVTHKTGVSVNHRLLCKLQIVKRRSNHHLKRQIWMRGGGQNILTHSRNQSPIVFLASQFSRRALRSSRNPSWCNKMFGICKILELHIWREKSGKWKPKTTTMTN